MNTILTFCPALSEDLEKYIDFPLSPVHQESTAMIETLCSTVRTKTAPLNKLGQSIILSVFYAQQSNRINVETVTDTVAVSLLFIVMAQGYINHPLPPRSSRGPASLPDQVTVTLEGM